MVVSGIIIAGCEHADLSVQLVICTAGVILAAGGAKLLIIINS